MIAVKINFNALTTNPNNLIIDLRDTALFQQLHFPNTINIPVEIFNSQIPFLPSHKHIYLICETGKNAQILAEKLQNMGYHCHGIPYGFSLLFENQKKDGNFHLNV